MYKPKRPSDIDTRISEYTKNKLPHFFIYAKDKTKKQVEKVNNSVVNKLNTLIPNPKINFKSVGLDNFDYKMLMFDPNVDLENEVAKQIIEKYEKADLKKYFLINRSENEDDKIKNILYLYEVIRGEIAAMHDDISYIVDVLIKYLYTQRDSDYKTTLWSSCGDVIVRNIKRNINKKLGEGYIQCSACNKLMIPINNKHKYCDVCAKDIQFNQKKHWDKNKRIRKIEHRQDSYE